MKKYIITVLSLALALSSCSDYLNKLPENKLPVDQVDYTQTANMFQAVAGVYSVAGDKLGSWVLYGLISVRGDDVEKGSSVSDQAEFQYAKDFQYARLTSYWGLDASWNSLFNLVQTCNSALVALDNYAQYCTTSTDKALNAQYQAEVRFIRAYSFFYITRLWGDAPLLLNNDDVKKNIGKNTRAEIYAFIDSELDYCIANLPDMRPNQMINTGEVTKYTALALKAKAASDLGNWDVVLNATNQIVTSGKFSLYPDFYELFKKPGKMSNETLYELQYTDSNSAGGTMTSPDAWFDFQYPRVAMKGSQPMDGGWGFMIPSQGLVSLFTARGESVRANTTFLFTNSITQAGDTITAGGVGEPTVYDGKVYLPSKELTPGRTNPGAGNNIRMIRYADMLLLNAEAKVRGGANGDAEINLVRARAGMPALTNATVDQILEERHVELSCEWGERFFDLVRTDKAKDVLPGFVKGQSEFYPVPQAEIDLDPALGN